MPHEVLSTQEVPLRPEIVFKSVGLGQVRVWKGLDVEEGTPGKQAGVKI